MTVDRAALRRGLLLVALAAGVFAIFTMVRGPSPLDNWLSVRLLGIWSATALFTLAALVAGNRVVTALMGETLEPLEHWPLAFSSGVLCFFAGSFVAGLLGLYGSVAFFVGLPAVLLLVGWQGFVTRLGREWADGRWRMPPMTALELAIAGAVIVALGLTLLPLLEPDNLSFDAIWYHVPNAEYYVATGRIAALPEGRLEGVIPQLASIIHVWALHLPNSILWDRLVLLGHLELVVVLGTLAALPALCRALYPGELKSPWLAAAVFFLFPSVFVYDTGLHGGADHYCAVFAAPAWLVLLRFWPRLDPRAGVLLGLYVAALVLTKYVAAPAVAVLGAAVALRGAWLAFTARPGARVNAAVPGLAWCGGAVLVATAPLWLKNWVFYGSPTYPFLSNVFHPTVWNANAPEMLRQFGNQMFAPHGNFAWNLRAAIVSLYDFSFAGYGYNFHGGQPVFGSVFTALLVALPFLKAGRRLWAIVLGSHAAVLGWYLMSHEQRYLLIVMPWMAAATAAMIALAWREGPAFKVLVTALVGVQVVVAAEMPFYPRGDGPSAVSRGIAVIGSAHNGARRNLERAKTWARFGEAIPKQGRVLLHQQFDTVGLQSQTVVDLLPHQFGLSYGLLGSLGAIDDRLKQLGVTHLAWTGGHHGGDSITGELLFHAYLRQLPSRSVEGITLATLVHARPAERGDVVQVVSCDKTYRTGLYGLDQLAIPLAADLGNPAPLFVTWPEPRQPGIALDGAHWLVIEKDCRQNVDVRGFVHLAKIPGELELYQRR